MRGGRAGPRFPSCRGRRTAILQGTTTMSDATHGLPIHTPDPDFGRNYLVQGDVVPEFRLARGWWVLPMMAGGIAGWALLLRAVLF